jgi:hypothetical protein
MRNNRNALKQVKEMRRFLHERSRTYRNTGEFLKEMHAKQVYGLRSAAFAVDLASYLLRFGKYPDFPASGFYPALPEVDRKRVRTLLEHRLLLSELPSTYQIE